jgi:glycosyltransferase involved in cell wall biosynthesis
MGAANSLSIDFTSELSPLGVYRIAKALKKICPDIVHSHDAHSLTPLLVLKFLGGKFELVHTRRVDFRINTLKKYDNSYVNLAAISEGVRRVLRECGVKRDIALIYSGTPIPAPVSKEVVEVEKAALGVDGVGAVFGTTAAFAPHKDFPTMLKAFKQYLLSGAKGKLLLVGGGDGYAETAALAKELGIAENTIFTGFKDDVRKYLKCMDVYLATSNAEGLNTSIIDAMHMGLPIAASRVGGIPELVKDGENGLLVEVGDYKGFALAMRKLSENPELRSNFSKASVEYAKNFTDIKMVNGYIQMYENLMANKKSSGQY